MNTLPLGKLPPDLLAQLLPTLPTGPRVILGPRPGEDAAILDMPDRYLVAKTDPITFTTDEIGWYAVQVCANDVATTGATPLWFLATILLPGGQATEITARHIFAQITGACRALNVAVVGGHTEITHDLSRPIVVGCMLGEVAKDRLVRTGGAQPGDVILLTKGAPIEATAIMAREKRAELTGRFSEAMLDRCAHFLHEPGISVVRDARLAMEVAGVTSMHDPTEGGVLSALWELAEASGCAVEVDLYGERKPWLPEGEALCKTFDLDPAGAIASGALLLTVDRGHVGPLEAVYRRAQVPVYRLGTIKAGTPAVVDSRRGYLARPARDEIARLVE
jgi:hydrogenase expression/formation protein HypE